MQMDTIIVGPVKLEVGSKSYCTDVAPIDDDMLLGLDFLKRHQTGYYSIFPQGVGTFCWVKNTQSWFIVLEETSWY
jgi:hypothetical protein